jgi:hypothetical protein
MYTAPNSEGRQKRGKEKMLRKSFVAFAGSLLLGAALAGPLSAQDSGSGGIGQPVTLDAVQVVPITVDVAVPTNGDLVTASLPLSAEVSVRVKLVDDAKGQSAAFPTVGLDDAGLLLPILSELPTGFFRDGDRQTAGSNESVAAQYDDPAAFLKYLEEEAKRQGGVYEVYSNSQYSPLAGGNALIRSGAYVMGDAAGADLYLTGAMERELERSDDAEAVYRLSAPRLGDNSVLFKVDLSNGDTQLSNYSLWVRVNNAILSLEGQAMRNNGNVDQLIDIARVVLARGLAQPAQEETVALKREGGATAPESARTAPPDKAATTPKPTATSTDAGSVWDLPHYIGSLPAAMDIGGFSVKINNVALFDFAEAKAFDKNNEQFYENSPFANASVLGVMNVTLTNGTDQDLALRSSDAVVVVGSEQVQLSDFQYVSDDVFGEALLPGVNKEATVFFALTDTSYDELGDSVNFRLQMNGPYLEDYSDLVKDAKYKASLTLAPAP